MAYALLDRLSVVDVELKEVYAAEITSDLEMALCHFLTVRDDNLTSLPGYQL